MNEFVERLGWVLVHSLWQFALMALLAGVTVQALRRRSAALRYVVLVVALVVSVAAPLATWFLQPSDIPEVLASRRASALGQDANDANSPEADAGRLASSPFVVSDVKLDVPPPDIVPTNDLTESHPVISPPAPTKAAMSWSDQATSTLRPWLAWIVAGWSLGVVLCSLRPLLGWQTLWRLKRVGVSAASDEVLAAMNRVSQQLGLHCAVRVMQSTLAQVPVVVGYFKPVILLPLSLVTSIPAAQLEAILAHELAHVRRHDFVVNLLQTLVETLFFYHPAVWWLSHQIRVEREHCCDDLVVKVLGNRVEYGRALIAVEELRGRSTVLALGATDGSLLSRVQRIVSISPNRTADDRSSTALVSVAMFCAVCALSLTWGLKAKDGVPKIDAAQPFVAELPNNNQVEPVASVPPDLDKVRTNAQAALAGGDYAAMEAAYQSLVTAEVATHEDAMWLGHAQHLQRHVKDAATSYQLMLSLADQRIVTLDVCRLRPQVRRQVGESRVHHAD